VKKNRWVVVIVVVIVACLCLYAIFGGALSIPTPTSGGDGISDIEIGMREGTIPPSGGTCGNINKVYEENPFYGWPVERFYGDWRSITSWFCDPNYFVGYTHWGLDFGSRVTLNDWFASIDHSEVMSTADLVWVGASVCDGGIHFGMGNHVIVKHVTCSEVCGQKSDYDGQPTVHVTVLDGDSRECTVAPPEDYGPGMPTLEPEYDDLLNVCVEDGWKASYFHLYTCLVEYGDYLPYGTVIGQINNNGFSSGPHLHYQINGPGIGAVDPSPTICTNYSPEFRLLEQYNRPICPDYPPYGDEPMP